MRGTLHIVSWNQTSYALTATAFTHHRAWLAQMRDQGVPVDRIREQVVQYCTSRPRTHREIESWLQAMLPAFPDAPNKLWRLVSATGDLIHAPPSGHFDNFARSRYMPAAQVPENLSRQDADEHLVRSHLLAFGPATVLDIARWSGLSVVRIRDALQAGDIRSRYVDHDGSDLFLADDLNVDGTEVPPTRLLPAWDNVMMGYATRGRFLDSAMSAQVVHRNGDISPVILDAGRIVGTWRLRGKGDARRLQLVALTSLTRRQRATVEAEAEHVGLRFYDTLRVEWSKT
jgi:hypothetical protein